MTEVLKRDEWLTKAMEMIIEKVFKPHNDLIMPPLLRIAAGLCPGKAIGICADPKYADDAAVHIWITPELGKDDVMTILGTIVHELCHATCCAQGYELSEVGHGAPFTQFIRDVGLEGKPKTTTVGENTELWATLQGIAMELGPYDHAPLRKKEKAKRQSMIATFCSESDPEYEVKIKFNLAYENGIPKDYNGQPMKPKDPQKWAELEEIFLSQPDEDAEAEAAEGKSEAAE
jgi:hypothetical protein